jgi:hypothetical protein
MASPAHAMAFDVRPILLARDQRLFLSVTPIRRKNRLIIDVSALTPRAASNRSQRVQGDVGFPGSQRFEKLTMRLEFRAQVSAHPARRARTAPLEPLDPLDGRSLAHPKPSRRPSPAHPFPNHRIDHPVAQILRIR